MVGRTWQQVRSWLDRRPSVLPLLVLGALLIALAAGPAPTEDSWTGLPDASAIRWVLGVIVAILATMGLVIILMTRKISNEGKAKRRSWLTTLAASLLLIGLFSLLDFDREPLPEEAETLPLPPVEPIGPGIEPGPGFETGDVTALVLILAAAIILLIWTRRAIMAPEVEAGEESSPLVDSLSRAEEHLLDGDDPRQAVLLAYRDLERTLESLDVPRQETDTPTEHLDRALLALSITDPAQARPLRELAGLYARARYSDHRISPAEQRRAGESLGRARQRLVGAA